MIKGLQGIGGVTVSGGNTSVPYVNQNHTNPIQGMLRMWGSDMQVFDGTAWINIGTSYATVGLDQDVLDIVQWARKKRNEERDLEQRMAQHPGLKQAYEQFRIMDVLTLEEKKNEQSA
jgi:hypothetical protein